MWDKRKYKTGHSCKELIETSGCEGKLLLLRSMSLDDVMGLPPVSAIE